MARIVPMYLLAWAIAWVVYVVALGGTGAKEVLTTTFPITLLQSWVPVDAVYFGGDGASWSLSDEAFFYAIFPVVAAAAIPLAVHTESLRNAAYWLIFICPPVRALEFLLGACLCSLVRRGVRIPVPVAAAGALMLAAYLLAGQVPTYLSFVVVTIIPVSLLIVAFAQSDLDGRRSRLHAPALLRLGQWSYAFYLLHGLVAVATIRFAAEHHGAAWALALFALTLGASVAAAALAFRMVEHPFERRIRRGGSATPAAELAAA